MARLLDDEEIDRQLQDLPGVHRGAVGTLATALTAPSFAAAARLLAGIADEAEQMDHHPDVDLRWRTVTCTFRTHSAGGVTQLDVELAHRVLEQARAVGAEPAARPGRVEVALDCADPGAVRRFWRVALGYTEQVTSPGDAELRDPAGRGPVLWFQRSDGAGERAGQRFHLDVYLPEADAPERVRACVEAGGTLTDDSHAPGWWVVADPEGNHVCICT